MGCAGTEKCLAALSEVSEESGRERFLPVTEGIKKTQNADLWVSSQVFNDFC